MHQPTFFTPWIGEHYQQGISGIRTLILGTAHQCLIQCPYKERCCSPSQVAQMDYQCPCYTPFQHLVPSTPEEEMCLHNSNIIELTAYCNDETGYPAFSNLTHFLLKQKSFIDPDTKHDFWNRMAFTNLLQNFIPSKQLPPFKENEALYLQAIPQFKELLERLQPQQIYVIGHPTTVALAKSYIKGLRKEILQPQHPTMELSLYSYHYQFRTDTVEYVRKYLAEKFPQGPITRSSEGIEYEAVSIEHAILNAIKHKLLYFDDNELLVHPQVHEWEARILLSGFRIFYSIGTWANVEILLSKFDKSGHKVKDLRKLHSLNPSRSDWKESRDEIQYKIFKVIE